MRKKIPGLLARLAFASLIFNFAFLPGQSLADSPKNFWPDFPAFPTMSKMPKFPDFPKLPHAAVCGPQLPGDDLASCNARVVTDGVSNQARNFITPPGYGPKSLRAAYGTSGIAGTKRIIAIVDAYDDPNIQSDLNTYSAQFGIPSLPACSGVIASATSPCFKKVDQNGGANYPARNSGWALEIALDVEAAHAMCQDCSILLVEAASNSFNNLLSAEDRAGILGASVISNSWGGGEFSGETSYDYHFNKPGIAITVSSGDSGYGVEYPASSRYVTAVGGTSLSMNGSSYGGEAAWSGAGSGCSQYEPKPAWQTDTACARRTVADVSAVADPSTGISVYDSVRYGWSSGWFQVGGTSLAAPIVAAMYALSGNTSGNANSLPYSLGNGSNLHDITSGANGSCGNSYLCTAKVGYDGPTGLGSPNGSSAF